jgi:hypothetical protein
LEAWRRGRSAAKLTLPTARVATPKLATERGKDRALVAVLVLMAVMSPMLGLVFALIGARDRHVRGRLGARNVMLVVGAVAVALLFVPALRFGVLQLIF